MGIFTELSKAWRIDAQVDADRVQVEAQWPIEAQRAILADELTMRWLATAICDRTELSFYEAASLVSGVASGGGPDLRTSKGMACASIILGVPGAPIQPALH